MIASFKQLTVWQRSMELVQAIYAVTEHLPGHETYGLASQLRRAAVSISANIAEGRGRRTARDFSHFLRIADGSASEVDSHLEALKRLYPNIDLERSLLLLDEVQRMLSVMVRKLEAQSSKLAATTSGWPR